MTSAARLPPGLANRNRHCIRCYFAPRSRGRCPVHRIAARWPDSLSGWPKASTSCTRRWRILLYYRIWFVWRCRSGMLPGHSHPAIAYVRDANECGNHDMSEPRPHVRTTSGNEAAEQALNCGVAVSSSFTLRQRRQCLQDHVVGRADFIVHLYKLPAHDPLRVDHVGRRVWPAFARRVQ